MIQSWTIAFMLAATVSACAPSQPQVRAPRARSLPLSERVAVADVLFDEAEKLTEAGQYNEACPKYEESDRLDHRKVTLYQLADCWEHIGRTASAWKAFDQVASEAKLASKTEHEREARERADKLKPRRPTLTIAVPPSVSSGSGLQIKRDDDIVIDERWNQPVPVDPGEHTIVVTAPGTRARQERVSIQEAETKTVTVEKLEAAPMPTRRIAAMVSGGVGLAGLVVGSISGIAAIVQWNSALHTCGDVTKAEDCLPNRDGYNGAVDKGKTSAVSATVSTVGFVFAGAGAATGVLLWFTTPSGDSAPAPTAWQITPLVGPSGAGAVVGRRF